MTPEMKGILELAMALPEKNRLEIAEKLLASVPEGDDSDVEAAWDEEIARRLADLDSGRSKSIPWEDVRERLMAGRKNGPSQT